MKQNQPQQTKRWLKNLLKASGLVVGSLILGAILARFVIPPTISLLKPLLVTPTKITVILPSTTEKEPFDIYVGNIQVDGGGDYLQMEKVDEITWEAETPINFGNEKDLDAFLVLKARESDLTVPASLSASTTIKPRINDDIFQKGMEIVDYWSSEWGDQEIAQTNSELKKSQVQWVYLAPFWDLETANEPKIENTEASTIQYSKDQLKNHIKKLQEDGLEILMAPGLCCTPQAASFDKSPQWWEQFFSQYENFMLYHARLAEETGVKIFVFSIPSQAWITAETPPPDAEKKWQALYQKVRNVYRGKLALFDYVCCGAVYEGVGEKLKSRVFQEDVQLLEQFDLFVLSLWNPLTKSDNPSQEELYQNAALILDDKIKHLYDQYQKPIILQSAYRSADGASQGTRKYPVELLPPDWQEKVTVEIELGKWKWSKNTKTAKKELPFLVYDAREQAMIYEALLRAVAEREWIIGFYPFVYHMQGFDFPRHPDYDLRRKPAETILASWYLRF